MDPNTLKLLMGSSAAGAVADKLYIEDVFSTFLYTGTGSAGSVVNGIDLLNKGGLVWRKGRNTNASHFLHDTVRSPQSGMPTSNRLSTDTDLRQFADTDYITSWNADGFSFGTGSPSLSGNGNTVVSWTFRKAAKFFDVVTYTGNGSNRTIAHSLGSVPGCIIVKRTDSAADWQVYHRSLANTEYLVLNSVSPKATGATRWNSTTPTSSEFTIGTDSTVNANGGSYVAYIFAHDAGGFGDSGNDNVVSCGTYTGNGSTNGPTVTLGWEPQWLLIKNAAGPSGGGDWNITDALRGFTVNSASNNNLLFLSSSTAEQIGSYAKPSSTGFQLHSTSSQVNASGETYIYIAIRRGPMKTPTDATKVFNAVTYTGTGTNSRVYTGAGFPLDAVLINDRLRTYGDTVFVDRLRGAANLNTTGSFAESTGGLYYASKLDSMDGYTGGTSDSVQLNISGLTLVNYFYRRAPGFFDVVAYTGTGSVGTVSHNLGVTPELMIIKNRSSSQTWYVYSAAIYGSFSGFDGLGLNTTNGANLSNAALNSTQPTQSVFSLGTLAITNASGQNFINYLFASCPGVSKVGSYTGTGSTLSINCGFTAGARFVLIKRADSTGSWYVWDTARGIISANDPFLWLNSIVAENTSTDYIDPLSTGFEISSTAPAAINASGGTYIYLAIA